MHEINFKKKNRSLKKLIIAIFFLLLYNLTSFANIVDELTSLNNLYKEGAISKNEFEKAKSIILKTNNDDIRTNIFDSEKLPEKKLEKKIIKTKINNQNNIKNRNIDLSKTYISIEEFNKLGSYEKIETYPKGLFKNKMSSKQYAQDAMMKMYNTFVKAPRLLEKYPENMMKSMAYFEIFYNHQLKDKKKSIENFKNNYPDINWKTKKDIKTLFSLNSAKKSMREALALNQENTLEESLGRYVFMHNFLKPAEKITHKLSSKEKKLKRHSSILKKNYGNFKKTITEKSENRLDNKDFKKQIDKNIKNLNKSFKSITKIDASTDKFYKSIKDLFDKSVDHLTDCNFDCSNKDLNLVIDATKLNLAIIKEVEPNFIKKKYSQNMENLKLDEITEEDQATLALITAKLKIKKKNSITENQEALLNLQSNGVDIDPILNSIEENGFQIKSISMSYDTLDNMKRWAMKDWANSWRGELPDNIKDSSGNLIDFSQQNVNDIKAQLAYNSFKSLIDSPDLKNAINENISDGISDLAREIKESGAFNLDEWLSQDFSISLDNYSQLVGNSFGIELKNFEDLTQVVNDLYGSNMTSEEYAAAWETSQYLDGSSTWGDVTRGVDLINQLGSFDAASIAKDLGADLSTVADSIVAAANVGVSTDLEAAAQGLGYSSFADAVRAYNEKYGTNYTEESAREALGQ